MKKREHLKRPYLPSLPHEIDPDAYLFFRLCHVCLYLSESPTEIIACQRCLRTLTVEPYLRDHARELRHLDESGEQDEDESFDSDDEGVGDDADGLEEQSGFSPTAGMRWRRGLTGLSVFW